MHGGTVFSKSIWKIDHRDLHQVEIPENRQACIV